MYSCNFEWKRQHAVEFRQSLASAVPGTVKDCLLLLTAHSEYLLNEYLKKKKKGEEYYLHIFLLTLTVWFFASCFPPFLNLEAYKALTFYTLNSSKMRQHSSHVTSDNLEIKLLDWANHLSYFSIKPGKMVFCILIESVSIGRNCHLVMLVTY